MDKKFDAGFWLGKAGEHKTVNVAERGQVCGSSLESDIETVTRRIEDAGVDITNGYKNWLDVGFALADALGEAGRSYFHRVSRLNPGYSEAEADRQYSNCLKANGSGITARSFFQRAKDCGISVDTSSNSSSSSFLRPEGRKNEFPIPHREGCEESEENEEAMPSFSEAVRDKLPGFMKKIAAQAFSEQDADILLLGALTCLSACLPNVSGVYDRRTVFPNLFLFVSARASSGKGRLGLCRHLVDPIHRQLQEMYAREREQYNMQMQQYNAASKKEKANLTKPDEPPLRMLFVPANASATAVYQVLNDNGGKGLMFENEGDTLANTLSSDYGNYSDGFRKAFHHETISYVRRKDKEYVELRSPKLSVLLSGTPRQILNLIPDAENGLFSRFMFYYLKMELVWKDVFADCSDGTADEVFRRLGEEFFDFYSIISASGDIRVRLSPEQGRKFNNFFGTAQSECAGKYGDDMVASVRRLGLSGFRIMMVLSVLRVMDSGEVTNDIECLDDDFEAAMEILKALLVHTVKVFRELPAVGSRPGTLESGNYRQKDFLSRLGNEFCRQDYLDAARDFGISDATAERYVKNYCDNGIVQRTAPGKFRKI